ncbi:hypothetical protein OIE66_27185 [Nonomuraea sp. NBC_01738]|uniref:hypothetical protein n=1 Tax=Nonomuraea sp. NBC_01738 TaxID=2976003 RepID=UPI002E0D66E6|nr:hypothetical protein OIE66_27185 [Nonomuraea sp. NBC_01738]
MTPRRVLVERRPAPARGGTGGLGVCAEPPDPHRDRLARAVAVAQLRGALPTVAVVALVLAGMPVLALLLRDPRWWVVLSLAVQPVWVTLAVLQLRRAERLER